MGEELKANVLNMGTKGHHELHKTIILKSKDGKNGKKSTKNLYVSVRQISNVKKIYGKSERKP